MDGRRVGKIDCALLGEFASRSGRPRLKRAAKSFGRLAKAGASVVASAAVVVAPAEAGAGAGASAVAEAVAVAGAVAGADSAKPGQGEGA